MSASCRITIHATWVYWTCRHATWAYHLPPEAAKKTQKTRKAGTREAQSRRTNYLTNTSAAAAGGWSYALQSDKPFMTAFIIINYY